MPVRISRIRWWCKQCNKMEWKTPSAAKIKKYCCNECKGKASKVENPVRKYPAKKPIYADRPCEHCGKQYRPATLHQRFCSLGCSGQSRKAARIAEVGLVTCQTCKKEFIPRKQSAGRFCSIGCSRSAGGALASGWKGGRSVRADGYVFVVCKGHPNATRDGYVLEHRLAMEKHFGRSLERHETVHHINGDRADNRIENLQLRQGNHGKGVLHCCADCGSQNIITKQIGV